MRRKGLKKNVRDLSDHSSEVHGRRGAPHDHGCTFSVKGIELAEEGEVGGGLRSLGGRGGAPEGPALGGQPHWRSAGLRIIVPYAHSVRRHDAPQPESLPPRYCLTVPDALIRLATEL